MSKRAPNTPLTDSQIIAVTVGERKLFNSTVHLSPYNPQWPKMFAQLAKQIHETLGDKVLRLEHVGSTAVPKLSAKPIIDMILVVADSRDEASYVTPLEKNGFTLRIREPEWHEHRLLKSSPITGSLHVFSEGCEEIEKMLVFRDWLRKNENDRVRYENKKRELAAQTWKYRQNYADAKSEIVQEILTRATQSQLETQ